MMRGDADTAAASCFGFDPYRADTAARGQVERIIADDHAGSLETKSDRASRKQSRRTELIDDAKDQACCIGAVIPDLGIICLQQKRIASGIGRKRPRQDQSTAGVAIDAQFRLPRTIYD